LVYLDPPYYVKGSDLYRNYYTHGDHVRIARLLASARFRRPWIVSYDNVVEIRAMYEYARSFDYRLNYTAQRRYVGAEVMFFSDRLLLSANVTTKSAA
jgi:DNA adenine methylase